MPMPQLESLMHESRWRTLQFMGDILEKRTSLRLGHRKSSIPAHHVWCLSVSSQSLSHTLYFLLLP
jgi:hypothetical protein